MDFTSINPTNPRNNPLNFHRNFLRIDDFEKLSFFESAILEKNFQKKPKLFLLNPHENHSKLLGYQGCVQILMITVGYTKRVSVRNNLLHSVMFNRP